MHKRHFGEFLAGKYRVLIGNVLLCIRNQVLHGRYTVIPEIIGDFGEYSYSLCDCRTDSGGTGVTVIDYSENLTKPDHTQLKPNLHAGRAYYDE